MRYRDCENCGNEIDVREVVTRCPECKELIYKPKTQEMKNKFKKGDNVYVYPYGWGILNEIQGEYVIVHCHNKFKLVSVGLVSFTPYTLQGFTQERPFEPVVGQYYYYWSSDSLKLDCVGLGKYRGKSNDELAPYKFGKLNFPFCSETNPLL